ncbi:UNVERIFIED_CONTAM: hypothetical protein RF649_13310 [Kocuria sp. CPCC 205295]|uniref:hypothetical protein n=1 Tax=Kocuria sp. CPCC 205295 TaxID=3073557 RepID=UPI0036DA15B9
MGGASLVMSMIIIVMRLNKRKGAVGPIFTTKTFHPMLIVSATLVVVSFGTTFVLPNPTPALSRA